MIAAIYTHNILLQLMVKKIIKNNKYNKIIKKIIRVIKLNYKK